VESGGDPMRDPEGGGRVTGDVGGIQNKKIGLERCSIGRERDNIPFILCRRLSVWVH
jgi:hypothetical protein